MWRNRLIVGDVGDNFDNFNSIFCRVIAETKKMTIGDPLDR